MMKLKIKNMFVFFNKKYIKYGFIIFGLYLFFLITSAPATLVLSWLDLPKDIKLSSISGSIWSGEAKQFRYANIEVGQVKWELHSLSLVLGKISADISLRNNEQYFNSEITLSPSGKIELEDTRFSVDLSSLQPLTYGMPFAYAGKASGYFPVSLIHKNHYVGINGKLSLSSLALISPQQQTFGDFTIDFRAEKEGATLARIKDVAGPLSLAGQVTLSKNGQLSLTTKLSARESGTSLEQMLAFLGKKDASGRVAFNYNYKLWP